MANPVPVTYSAAASPVAGGRYVWPAWRRGRAPMSVFAIPASNTLNALNPRYNPAMNPVYPNKPEWDSWGSQASIILAWCGACWGEEVTELWLPLSGGHADYAGNEPYYINLRADVPSWVMPRPPSGAIGNLLTTSDGQEVTGVYADGRPRSVHSYNKPQWIPGVGPVLALQGSTSHNGQNGTKDFLQIDRATGECIRKPQNPVGINTFEGGGGCYDASRHSIWFFGVGSGRMGRYDVAANTWTAETGALHSEGELGMCHIPGLDALFVASTYYASGCWLFDCAAKTRHELTVTGSPACVSTGFSQPVWVPELNAVAQWDNNAANAHRITLYHPPANPKTSPWPITTLEFTIEDQPTGRCPRGTYGRFFYSRRLGGFGVVNATNQPIYFYALR